MGNLTAFFNNCVQQIENQRGSQTNCLKRIATMCVMEFLVKRCERDGTRPLFRICSDLSRLTNGNGYNLRLCIRSLHNDRRFCDYRIHAA